jgi:hypothetical protein
VNLGPGLAVIERVRAWGVLCALANRRRLCKTLQSARVKLAEVIKPQEVGVSAVASHERVRISIPAGVKILRLGGRIDIDYGDVAGKQRQRTVLTRGRQSGYSPFGGHRNDGGVAVVTLLELAQGREDEVGEDEGGESGHGSPCPITARNDLAGVLTGHRHVAADGCELPSTCGVKNDSFAAVVAVDWDWTAPKPRLQSVSTMRASHSLGHLVTVGHNYLVTLPGRDAILSRYPAGQPFSIGGPQTAELAEAYLVLAGASLNAIHSMREQLLGPGVND